jgi:hypothetical protein
MLKLMEEKENAQQASVTSTPMMPREREKAWLSIQRKAVALYCVIGAVIGYVSYVLNQPLQAFAAAIVVCFVLHFAAKKALNPDKKLGEKRKWWGSPIIVYFGMWLVIWTILYNIYIVKAL